MNHTMPQDSRGALVNSIDGVRPKAAKASLPGQSLSIAMTAVVKDALLRHYGSLKCAALTLRMDEGQLSRELNSGDFKINKLDRDEEARAFVANALYEAFRSTDPKATARRKLREARIAIDEAMEQIA